MALDRTWFNALIDDDGSNTVGSVWDKADIKNLLDSVDAELARIDTAYIVPVCILSNTADVPWGHNVLAACPFTGEGFDPGGMHAPSDSRVYIPSPGIYCCNFVAQWGNNASGTRQSHFRANGTTAFPFTQYQVPASNGFAIAQITALYRFTSATPYSEWVEVMLLQDSGVTLTFATNFIRCEVYKVRGNY